MNVSLSSHAIYHARRHASDFSPGSVTFVDGFGDKSMNVSLNLHAIVHARRHASDFNPGSVTFVGFRRGACHDTPAEIR